MIPRHRFVTELFTGAVPDTVMACYLIQDHRFLDSFLVLLGAALAGADAFEARLRFGRFIGMVSAEENTHFLRAFEALSVTEARWAADPDAQPTKPPITTGSDVLRRSKASVPADCPACRAQLLCWLDTDPVEDFGCGCPQNQRAPGKAVERRHVSLTAIYSNRHLHPTWAGSPCRDQ